MMPSLSHLNDTTQNHILSLMIRCNSHVHMQKLILPDPCKTQNNQRKCQLQFYTQRKFSFFIVLLNCLLKNPLIVPNSNPFPDSSSPLHLHFLMGSEHWCIRIPSRFFLKVSTTSHNQEITHFPNPPRVLFFVQVCTKTICILFLTSLWCWLRNKYVLPCQLCDSYKICTTRFFQILYKHNISRITF